MTIKPTDKDPAIDSLITGFTGKNRRYVIEHGDCTTCDANLVTESLRNEISRREYAISGMCQDCQDRIFGKD